MSESEQTNDVTALTVKLLSVYLASNTVAAEDLAGLIQSTRDALGAQPVVDEQAEPEIVAPAVSVRKSLASPEHILSLIDGKPYKTLKRHLMSHGLTPDAYRSRYGLPASYPMVAPTYAEQRRAVAQRTGLGSRKSAVVVPGSDDDAQSDAGSLSNVEAPGAPAPAGTPRRASTARKGRPASAASDTTAVEGASSPSASELKVTPAGTSSDTPTSGDAETPKNVSAAAVAKPIKPASRKRSAKATAPKATGKQPAMKALEDASELASASSSPSALSAEGENGDVPPQKAARRAKLGLFKLLNEAAEGATNKGPEPTARDQDPANADAGPATPTPTKGKISKRMARSADAPAGAQPDSVGTNVERDAP